jgi:hypothetical protein
VDASEVGEGVPGGIESEDEQATLDALNAWVVGQKLPQGQIAFELTAPDGKALAYLDLAWPEGLQSGLSQPVAVLLNEGQATLAAANKAGYRYFTSPDAFRAYVSTEVSP